MVELFQRVFENPHERDPFQLAKDLYDEATARLNIELGKQQMQKQIADAPYSQMEQSFAEESSWIGGYDPVTKDPKEYLGDDPSTTTPNADKGDDSSVA